ncbi:MAG: sodium-dependent transporter, partial [Clostridiales bacterium]|nr:sodium-dependent transporter [Clostridiales bacterium]
HLPVLESAQALVGAYEVIAVAAIGRKTKQSPLTAYGKINRRWKGIGVLACLVPILILPYYCSIGGWVFKYLAIYLTNQGAEAAAEEYFSGYISGTFQPLIYMLIFFGITAVIVYRGVEKGIERYSKILMPILVMMIVGISLFSLTLEHTEPNGTVRTGLEGLKVYLVPNFSEISIKEFFIILMDAMGQLFFSISVAMGIMVAYGSYVRKDTNLMHSINQIEFFDTLIALLAGLMIVPAVFTFMGANGMSTGPGLIFVSLPKVFTAMGSIGNIIGFTFFLIVSFAAVTSSVSVMEAIVSSIMDHFGFSRKKSTVIVSVYTLIIGCVVCLGYNSLFFELTLPNGTVGQILDVLDYISNNCLMPLVALLTCVLIGWVVKPDVIIEEVTQGKYKFRRKWLYIIMIKFIAPIMLFLLLLQSAGLFNS